MKLKKRLMILSLMILQVFMMPVVRTEAQESKKRFFKSRFPTDLSIEGKIVAYDAGPILFNYCGMTLITIVKISKIFKGEETSQYIIVPFSAWGKAHKSNKTTTFNLWRAKFCDVVTKDFEIYHRDENDELKKTLYTRLKATPKTKTTDIPPSADLPCYHMTGE